MPGVRQPGNAAGDASGGMEESHAKFVWGAKLTSSYCAKSTYDEDGSECLYMSIPFHIERWLTTFRSMITALLAIPFTVACAYQLALTFVVGFGNKFNKSYG